ncbi:hypothetical protein [Suipraeoptans intestinalis]|uniref:hypothetical protein n=1 Tax=Suipraeoptans intestinalis TaxID=2606628 RepID=UPI001F2D74F4|nr:hypothetical protein [Suipraeoptans intestinalis]
MMQRQTTLANQVFAINKDSKKAEQAFELITYIAAGDFDKKMTEEALCIPATRQMQMHGRQSCRK